MPRIITHVRNEVKIKRGGIYCWLAYEDVGRNRKAPFKIGYAVNFNSRTESYINLICSGYISLLFLKTQLLKHAT